jgi:hypothetical protein
MANTDQDPILLSESNTTEEVRVSVPPADEGAAPASASQEPGNVSETVSIASSSATPKDSNSAPPSAAETRPASTPARPTLVQLGSQSSTSASHPHKKFNAVNINKKFLEKNSAAAMATTSSASASNKSTGSMCKLFAFCSGCSQPITSSLPLDISPCSAPADAKHAVPFPPCNRQAHWLAHPSDNSWSRLVATYVHCPFFDWDKLANRLFSLTNSGGPYFRQLCSPSAAPCRQGHTAPTQNSRFACDKLAKGKR